ncbi:rCG36586 [Rattus norvegicus]|uniref:RCG36586 n=1 Tax=Rattus norvegicus TaxID=10116 RepID=A6JSC4_RAT|nr:rCG36586 [Rattus norvegicus]
MGSPPGPGGHKENKCSGLECALPGLSSGATWGHVLRFLWSAHAPKPSGTSCEGGSVSFLMCIMP